MTFELQTGRAARALAVAVALACAGGAWAAGATPAPAGAAAAAAQDTGLLAPARAGDAQALAQLRDAAEAGNVRAQHELGSYLVEKGGFAEGYGWLRRAAEAGDPRAIFDLGALTLNGYGVPARDPALAQQYYLRAGAKGFAGGYRMAAEIALAGGAGRPDREAALRWLRQAAEAGDVEAQVRLAGLLSGPARTAQEMAEPLAWLRRAADAGHALAAEQLGMLTLAGLGTPRDPAAARQWLEKAARGGRVPAALTLARVLRDMPELRDPTTARLWLAEAARVGNLEARVALYEQLLPEGAEAAAAALPGLRAAAEAGHARAALRLAQAYEAGRGVAVDAAQAQFWRARALAGGEALALAEPAAAGR